MTTTPTTHRLARATTPAVVDPSGRVLTAANDNYRQDPVTRAYHVQDSPVERLAAAGKLSAVQKQAADRFFADYYNAGLAPLGAVDYGKAHVDGSSPSYGSDFRHGAADRWNNACKALSAGTLKIVDRVVLREMSVELSGRDMGYNNAPQARAVAMWALTDGLDTLGRHYKLVGE